MGCGFDLFGDILCLLVGGEPLFDLLVGLSVELLSEVRNDFDWVNILNFQFLVVAAALKGVAGLYEICHFPIELVASPFFLGFHDFLVGVEEGDILHVFLITPLARALAGDVLSGGGLLVVQA